MGVFDNKRNAEKNKVEKESLKEKEFILGDFHFWSLTKIEVQQNNKIVSVDPKLLAGINYYNYGQGFISFLLTGIFVDNEGISASEYLQALQEVINRKQTMFFSFPEVGVHEVVIDSFSFSLSAEWQDTSYDFNLTLKKVTKFHDIRIETTQTEEEEEIDTDNSVVHTVSQGECLWKIAIQYYGEGIKWRKIYEVAENKEVIGVNPNLIYPGQELIIPNLEA